MSNFIIFTTADIITIPASTLEEAIAIASENYTVIKGVKA